MNIKLHLSFAALFAAVIPVFADFIPANGAFKFNAYSMSDKSIISAAHLNEPITEEKRITVSPDGHLYANGKRLRIFGTNLSEFPSKENAEFAAKNLAAQGYNCIRFHHTDADWTHCFLKKDGMGKWSINQERLDDFDYFFAKLKENGIYSNINLLTGRSMSSADGFPADFDKSKEMKAHHSLGFWYEPARDYQKNYAKELLTHVNPYTGLSYCNDPAVAIVEINNENGFLMSYLSGWIKDYENTVFWKDLEAQWNSWLKENNLDFEKLSENYNKKTPVTSQLITKNTKGYLEQHQGAEARLNFQNGVHEIKIIKNGQSDWHVQYGLSGLNISSDKIYTIKFAAKASSNCTISVSLTQAHDPWKGAGFNRSLDLTPVYKNYEFTVSGQMTDDNLRLIFSSLGFLKGKTISIKDITLSEGGQINQIKTGMDKKSVAFPGYEDYSALPADYKNLVLNFLWEKELDYWSSMKSYLKNDLDFKGLLMGTSMGCSTTCIQNIFDIIDSHAYWNHPIFPGSSWDNSNYYVHNDSLTTADNNATLTSLAKYRVYGKPFSVSEYDHPYPNQFTAEAYPMLASFACFQDWDCIFTFCSELPKPSEIKNLHIDGYFDQSKNPTKACAAPFAARIFRNFMISPAENILYIPFDEKTERENLYRNSAWSIGNSELFGMKAKLGKTARIGIALDGKIPENSVSFQDCNESNLDTSKNQIYWDSTRGIYAANNKNVSITIASPGADTSTIPESFTSQGYLTPFKSSGDFAVFTALKENSHSIIFSCRWAGNKLERLKEYGKDSQGASLCYTRDNLNLTTIPVYQSSTTHVLNSEGTLENPDGLSLYSIGLNGEKQKLISSAKTLPFSSADQTIWYVLE